MSKRQTKESVPPLIMTKRQKKAARRKTACKYIYKWYKYLKYSWSFLPLAMNSSDDEEETGTRTIACHPTREQKAALVAYMLENLDVGRNQWVLLHYDHEIMIRLRSLHTYLKS